MLLVARTLMLCGLAIAFATTGGCARRVLWRGTAPCPDDCVIAPGTECNATRIATPQPCPDPCPPQRGTLASAPLTVRNAEVNEYLDLSLEDAVRIALSNTRVLNDLGATIVRFPTAIETVYDPAITETNPLTGVEAALSAFDAQFSTLVIGEQFDRPLNNNAPVGGGDAARVEDFFNAQSAITKRSAVGTEFTIGQTLFYSGSNELGNQFPNVWDTAFETSIRQPLARGAGVDFNRIGGPGSVPGVYRGVLVARVNTDISLADFEAGVRDFVSNVENLYWDLYFAYQNLDAAKSARDAGLLTWRKVQALREGGRVSSVEESQSRVQYFRFEQGVQDALAGRLFVGTQVQNGSGGGTFSSSGGVLTIERQLRQLMGLPISDGSLIRPTETPVLAEVRFPWDEVQSEAVARRVELRRQRWVVKRRELELIASRNFVKPQLDVVGTYRWRGLGDDLLQQNTTATGRFDSAWDSLGSGDFQEWQIGLELDVPLGFRQGHTGVRNAQLLLARERAVLREQERQVVLGVSNAIAEVDRALTVATTNYNLMLAARDQVASTSAAFDAEQTTLFVVLDAQVDLFDARVAYQQSVVEYMLALKNLQFEKGTLLAESGVSLTEGRWPNKAYLDAAERRRTSLPYPRVLNYVLHPQRTVSAGVHPQQTPLSVAALPDEASAEPTPIEDDPPLQ